MTPQPRWLRPLWYGLSLTALGVAGFWAQHVVSDYTTAEQRALVPLSTVWGLHACVVLGLIGFVSLALPLARWLGRRHLLTGLGLGVLGYAACALAPETTRIFYDEHIYMQIGQTLAHTGRAEYATYARVEYGDFTAYNTWVNKQPNGHPYVLSWAYRIGGTSEAVSHVVDRLAVGLTAALLYFALVIVPVTLPAAAPAIVALAFIFTPLVLWWGHTASVEPTTAATTVAGFFAACLHARWRNPETGEGSPLTAVILAATAAFAAYFRPESLLVFPVAATLLLAADRRFLEDRVTWTALALAFALLIPNLLHLWSVRTEDWGATDGRRFDTAFLAANFRSNAGYFFQQKWYPLAGTALAVAGAIWLAVRNRWFGFCAGVWFACSWGIFVLFYAGGYHYGASSRYAVVSAAPVALFVGIGAAGLLAGLRRQPLAAAGIGIIAVLNWITAMHYVPQLGRESNEARADVDFAHEAAAKLPTGSLIISNDPCLWNMLGRNSGELQNLESMVRTNLRELVRQYPGGIYLHWDYWVNCQPNYGEIWRQLVLDTHATVFARRNAEASKLAVFRLDTPYALEAMGGHAEMDKPRVDLDEAAAKALTEPAQAAVPPSDQPAVPVNTVKPAP
jgi:Dolichyl-phosphate-mannose-protein mannosyltransferase